MNFDNFYTYPSRRTVIYGNRGMVATSQPLAAQAGLDILKKGGNAVDAAVATAACLTIVEPTSNGIGGDAFAILHIDGKMIGLNTSGPSPELMSLEALKGMGLNEIPKLGLIPVTVPGIPKAWAELIEKYGNLSLKEILEPAIYYANYGYPVSPTVAALWEKAYKNYKGYASSNEFKSWFDTFAPEGRALMSGKVWKSENHAKTLEELAATNCRSFYEGNLADKIDAFSRKHNGFIRKSDLEKYSVEWIKPVSINYRGYDVWELPPNGHGIVALMALNILNNFSFTEREALDTYHKQIEAIKLAFADGKEYISDINSMKVSIKDLLSKSYGQDRAKLIGKKAIQPIFGSPQRGGTVYLATADGNGNMVSYIQSNYMGFGSGIVIPETGIALHNRGHNFNMVEGHSNCVAPYKKPYHTIIPGFLTKDDLAIGPFGVMGAFMQPQGHVQVVSNMIDFKLNPQEALNAPRWQWISDKKIDLEPSVGKEIAQNLSNLGHDININSDYTNFGRGQIILRNENKTYTGATEPRADGHVAVW